MHFPVLVKEDKVGKSQLNMFSSRVSPCPTTILPTYYVCAVNCPFLWTTFNTPSLGQQEVKIHKNKVGIKWEVGIEQDPSFGLEVSASQTVIFRWRHSQCWDAHLLFCRNLEGNVSLRSSAAIFTYCKSRGLFAGISLEGSCLIERKETNRK